MVLLKQLVMPMLLRNHRLLNIKKGSLCVHLTFMDFHHVRNVISYTKKFPNFWGVHRTFCTDLRQRSLEDMAADTEEDMAADTEEDMAADTEKDMQGVISSKGTKMSTDEMFQEIAAGDPDVLKTLKLLELETAVLREKESTVPEYIGLNQWKELLEIPTPTRRRKYLKFLRLNELKSISAIAKSKSRRESRQKLKDECGFHYYGLSGHTMFMRIYDKDINNLLNFRSRTSEFKVVIDCSYQDYMNEINVKACAKQIFYCLTEARLHRFPNQIKLCNFNKDDNLGRVLPLYLANIYTQLSDNIHSESYLNLFPRDKLVYLSPHANSSLKTFNPDDVYIIGAFVDKGNGVKASLAKAKENNLRMHKFPIDEYIRWKQGTKSLPLNIALNVLLEMGYYNDWNRAFMHLPRRCKQYRNF